MRAVGARSGSCRRSRSTRSGFSSCGAGVDRSTVMKLREVAKHGALAALAASRPGLRKAEVDHDLEAAKAEIARLGEALKEMSVRLMLVEGKGRWD